MHNVKIREATASDANLIARLSRDTFYDTFASQNTPENMEKFMTEQFTHERLMDEVGSPGNFFFLAELGEQVAGYVRLRDSLPPPQLNGFPCIEIARIYSIQSQIGKGIGSALMQKCVDVAYEKNKQVIWLGVFQENPRAIAFYERWGFEIFAVAEFVLGDDVQKDWLMKKVL